MLSFGTSSDRIFSPKGTQSYFMTVAKSLPNMRAAPYVSLFWSEWEDRFLFPFGVNVALAEKWDRCKMEMKLVNPANKRKFHVLVVGTGLAGGSCAASG